MEVRIQGIHFDVSEKLASFINKKVERPARRNVNITYVDVNLTVIKPETAMNKQAVIKIIVPHKGEQVAPKIADSFEEAIDTAIEALDRQLEKDKDKK